MVERWNGGTVERWNGGTSESVVSSGAKDLPLSGIRGNPRKFAFQLVPTRFGATGLEQLRDANGRGWPRIAANQENETTGNLCPPRHSVARQFGRQPAP